MKAKAWTLSGRRTRNSLMVMAVMDFSVPHHPVQPPNRISKRENNKAFRASAVLILRRLVPKSEILFSTHFLGDIGS